MEWVICYATFEHVFCSDCFQMQQPSGSSTIILFSKISDVFSRWLNSLCITHSFSFALLWSTSLYIIQSYPTYNIMYMVHLVYTFSSYMSVFIYLCTIPSRSWYSLICTVILTRVSFAILTFICLHL